MKGMQKFFSFLVAMIFCFCLVGCWDGDGGSKSEPAANEEDGTGTVIFTLAFPDSNFVADANFVDPNATGDVVLQWRKFDPRNLPEYKELPEPAVDEPSAIMGVGGNPAREKSSNEFYDFLRNDLMKDLNTGEVRLDFYGKDPLMDLYGEYLGSRTVKAGIFFAGTAQEKVKAQEYWIHAVTYCELSGYCFQADVHVLFFPNETNRVLFSFRPTGNVLIPCYIPNPAGSYLGNRYDQYGATLKANSAYIWNGPYYNERGELEFTISYAYGNLADVKDEEIELSVTATDGLHIMKFSFNLMDITRRQRPLQLVVEEVPTGTIQYSGEFEDEKREIIIDSPADGDVVGFPLIVKGTARGIKNFQVKIENGGDIIHDSDFYPFDTGEEILDFSMQWDTLGVGAGDNLSISLSRDGDSVRVDIIVGEILAPITVHKDTFYPDGSENAPNGIQGEEISAGNYIAHANQNYQAINVIVSTDYPLGEIADSMRIFVEDTRIAPAITTLNPTSTPTAYTFTWDIPFQMSKNWNYPFKILLQTQFGIVEPVNFNLKFSICGETADSHEHFQTPFVEGQNICIVPADYGYVYKSFPIISQIPLTNEELRIVNGVPQAIYKWKVEASSCGNIGIKQMPKIKVAWQDLDTQSELRLSSLRLFRGTTDITDFVEITNLDGVSVKMSALMEADKAIFIYFLPEEIIAEGATLFYSLKATPENFDSAPSGSDKVALIMLADNASAGNKRYVYCDNGIWKLAEDNAGTGAEQFNFLWSDRSALPHSAISGMSTADWFNGYLIKNLPLSHVIMEK